jgi:hypothetical protein
MSIEDEIAWHRDEIAELREKIADVQRGLIFDGLRSQAIVALRALADLHTNKIMDLECRLPELV